MEIKNEKKAKTFTGPDLTKNKFITPQKKLKSQIPALK